MVSDTRRLVITGVVQGVWYRGSMVAKANQLGVTGWVRNRRDGSVEAVVSGRSEQVEAILDWARRGPPGARVVRVAVEPAEGRFLGFEQRPTA